MQLPYFNHDPLQSAIESPDTWVKKLSIEAAQLLASLYPTEALATAPLTVIGQVRSNRSHPYHPITKWVHTSWGNYMWTWEYGYSCIMVAKARGLVKSAHHLAFFEWVLANPPALVGGLTAPYQPKGYTDLPAEVAYQAYFRTEKRHLAQWSNDTTPEWWY